MVPLSGMGMLGSLLAAEEPLRRPVQVPGFIVDLRRLPLRPSGDLGVGCLLGRSASWIISCRLITGDEDEADVDESRLLSWGGFDMSLSRERKKVVGPWLERSPVIEGGSPTDDLRGRGSTLSKPIPGLIMEHWKGLKMLWNKRQNDYKKMMKNTNILQAVGRLE